MASTVRCTECGFAWECDHLGPADKRISVYSGDCKSCGSSSIKLERCEDCPVIVLDYVRSNAPAGRLLSRIVDLRFDLKHFRMGLDEVTCEEWEAFSILETESSKWEQESARRASEDANMKRLQGAGRPT